jgi:CMP-N,N'-diacetyllegionaminic acid synthase
MVLPFKILGIIPARKGSKSVPHKHVRNLGLHPLIHYTLAAASQSKLLTKVMLSSNCTEIIKQAFPFKNVEVPFTRPDDLAEDHTPTIPVILHALEHYANKGENFDAICLLQPTTPFRANGLIDHAIEKFITTQTDSLITVQKIPPRFNPHWSLSMTVNQCIAPILGSNMLIPNRQALPDAYYRDGQIYLATVALVQSGTLLSNQTIGFLNEHSTDINIDEPADWQLAKAHIAHERNN